MHFSVVIPTYNRKKILPQCIKSVLDQTHTDFELIIVDNGSTDKTRDLVARYQKKDDRVKYIYQENSGSPAGSRNTGIKAAKHDWVAFLDSDDLWFENKLEYVAKAIKKSKHENLIAVSHKEEKIIDGSMKGILNHGIFNNVNQYEYLLYSGNRFSTSAMVVKRDALLQAGLFDTRKDYFTVEDYDMWMKISKLGHIHSIKQTLGQWIVANDNLSSNIDIQYDNLRKLINNHLERIPNRTDKLVKIHDSRTVYYKARALQKSGQFRPAISSLMESIKEYPWYPKKWYCLGLSLLRIKSL